MSESVLIIGAGHAGGRAAEALRKYGFAGEITLVGEEPTLPFERPPLSKHYLKELDDARLPRIRPEEWYEEQNITTLLNSRAQSINADAQTVSLNNGETLNYGQLLLTVGGQVRRLTVPGSDLAGIHYIRGLSDSRALHHDLGPDSRVVVVGGGFIGLEAAAVAREMGAEVTVLEAGPQLMGRAVLPAIANIVTDRFKAQGVAIELDAMVSGLGGDKGRVSQVHAGDRVWDCDVVIVGIGIVPDTGFAATAGVEIDNGIVVDEYCRTSIANIFAAGDVTSHLNPRYGRHLRLESWQNAQNQAIAAARNMAGESFVYDDVPWFWSDQFDFKIQAAGAPMPEDEVVVRHDVDGDCLAFQIRDGVTTGLQSIGMLKDMRRARKLLDKPIAVTPERLIDVSVPVKDLLKG